MQDLSSLASMNRDFEASCCEADSSVPLRVWVEEFGSDGQVPVGVLDAEVTEVGGQAGKVAFHVQTHPVPVEESGHGKAMA